VIDHRFRDRELYAHFDAFLPPSIRIVGAPHKENCYGYVSGARENVCEIFFQSWLDDRNPQHIDDSSARPGDVVTYYAGCMEPYLTHAGIIQPNGRARSRFGPGSPLLEHDLEDPLPLYGGPFGFFRVLRLLDPPVGKAATD
jgi:hypothetical protein